MVKTAGMAKVNVAVVGASGYTGGELLRLLAGHPHVTITAVTSEKSAGQPISTLFPNLASVLSLSFEALAPEAIAKKADVIFLALPHTKSFEPAAVCVKAGKRVIDLSADYRLKDPGLYQTWYKAAHPHAALLKEAVYGLPELHRAAIRDAKLIASPGCYPTAAILQLAPLAAKGLLKADTVVIDAKSGISGAGRSPALAYHFPEANESVEAYQVGQHRHIPEIEQELKVTVSFTPHLVPMNRGILSTAYCRLSKPLDVSGLRALYHDFYKGERFVRLQAEGSTANPRHVRGSNFCDLAVHADARAGWVVTVAALDNLVKGAAGQAIQAMNLMLDYPEETGLLAAGVYP
jgi:N-acetyl-gamma-glutamyl-phosphate reductase